jgi:hypothetical protein
VLTWTKADWSRWRVSRQSSQELLVLSAEVAVRAVEEILVRAVPVLHYLQALPSATELELLMSTQELVVPQGRLLYELVPGSREATVATKYCRTVNGSV